VNIKLNVGRNKIKVIYDIFSYDGAVEKWFISF
jgi:hypothetical protein